jgi:putative DeoR family transcriptional regulator (stage III sporulation protein D)
LLTKKTIREAAKYFNVSKSTVHKDLHERLINVNKNLYNKIKNIMQDHIETRHIKGGESTKLKYKVTKK